MQPELPPLVQRTLQRLVTAFAPQRVILFGSYAKQTMHSRSDVDLLVVADLDGNRELHQRRARQLGADCFPTLGEQNISNRRLDEVCDALWREIHRAWREIEPR